MKVEFGDGLISFSKYFLKAKGDKFLMSGFSLFHSVMVLGKIRYLESFSPTMTCCVIFYISSPVFM